MFLLEAYKQRQKSRYVMTVVFLLLMLGLGKYWGTNSDSLLSEVVVDAQIVSVNENKDGAGSVGSNLSFVTVQLENGQKAKISVKSDSPWIGQRIRVKVRDYASGSRKVAAIASP